jgi:hypothetical protein
VPRKKPQKRRKQRTQKTTAKQAKKEIRTPRPIPVKRTIPCRCFYHGHPLSTTLYLIGLIVIIYGAWFRELLWLVLGFVPIIIGSWWEHLSRT